MAEPNDRVLIDLACTGDRIAANHLLSRYYDRALTQAQKYCDNYLDAEDLVQETFLKAWQALPELRDEQAFWPWLRTIMRNQRVDESRSLESGPWMRRHYDPKEDNSNAPVIVSLDSLVESGWDIADPNSDPAQQYEDWEAECELRALLDELPPQHHSGESHPGGRG